MGYMTIKNKKAEHNNIDSEVEGDKLDYLGYGSGHDYTDIEEDEDGEGSWEEREEDWEQEMAELSKVEQLKIILRRLMEFRR